MDPILYGKCWIFGDNIDTDQIIQGQYLTLLDYSEMATHAFEVIRPDFASQVGTGDIIVAGRNFGSGSSREEAPMILKELGVSCVIAESFARIFYRNGFNVGLPLVVVPNITKEVSEGDELEVNLIEGNVKLSNDEILVGDRLPQLMMDILEAGGALNHFKAKM
jgi:3-isopropylmalate/(R)-2-methylmalate dehydratase small subunit